MYSSGSHPPRIPLRVVAGALSNMRLVFGCLSLAVLGLVLRTPTLGFAQNPHESDRLDPTLDIPTPTLESTIHTALPEQYVWSSNKEGTNEGTAFFYRKSFAVKRAPSVTTLYVAGPRIITVYVNGRLLASGQRDAKERIQPFMLAIDISGQMRVGRNVLAIIAAQGDRLVAKIVPAALQIMKPALVVTDSTWKCDVRSHPGWEKPGFDDRAWAEALSLGRIEDTKDLFQGNEDAGMYRWPGYDGISPFLAHTVLKAVELTYGFEGLGRFTNISELLEHPTFSPDPQHIAPSRKGAVKGGGRTAAGLNEAAVFLPARKVAPSEYPYLVLGFGKECPGRIRVISDSPAPMRLEIQYGESAEEAVGNPYLGANEIYVPPYGTAYGPKSAFAYALIRFLGGSSPLRFKTIDADYVYYPVRQLGSFESSDPVVNKIWQEGAYTAHLCMQDRILDGVKRDRMCLAGGLDISGRVISTVFADRFLMTKSLQGLIDDTGNPVSKDVNGIPGFSALWVMCEADYFRHSGDLAHLKSVHEPLRSLMEFMATRINDKGLFTSPNKTSTFIDWSPDLDGDSAESRRVTMMEFLPAFSEGAWLLEQVGDATASERFRRVAEKLRADTLKNALDPARKIFGELWQTNAMALYAGLADDDQRAAVWDNILSRPYRFNVTPHLNFYAISAMAEAGHREEALDWIKDYWGGMLKPETTTFWEGYDPRWEKEHFHGHLQTDHGEGYFVSLCHGWASGATAWLAEQVLGLRPVAAGFAQVSIRPDLCGLQWVRGSEPCPQGVVKVDYRHDDSDFRAAIEIPEGVTAQVSMPVDRGVASVLVNGRAVSGVPAENGTRVRVTLSSPGLHELHARLSVP